MTLAAGTRLGPYEILAPLGAGGMGEVYKARDTRLERTVAVKVLPSEFSASAEHKQRFEREAKAISQLTHAHICTLYDVGSENGIEYLVMELLEGETLTAKLAKGPLPLDLTMRFGLEMAEALDKAHRQGIVHRDLKPGNVMVTKAGVKLLDFGLAKAMDRSQRPLDAAGREQAAAGHDPKVRNSLTALPTVAGSPNLTEAGTILGTFQYMSPEQLEGKEADARTDIFALGAVLFEMATGKKAFAGSSQASLITAIMSADPPSISAVQPMSPPTLDRAVRKCLAKDPEDRWQSAADLGSELKWIAEGSAAGVGPAGVLATPRRVSRERSAWLVAALAGLVAAGALFLRQPTTAPAPRMLLSILPPPGTVWTDWFTLSPDGSALAFVGSSDGKLQIWIRRFDEDAARPVPGTEGADDPFWSPDGRSVGFFSQGKLRKVELESGAVQVLCDAEVGRGATWSREGVILFTPSNPSTMFRVPAAGGAAVPVTKLDAARGDSLHRWPQFLSDGDHFVVFVRTADAATTGIYLGSLGAGELKLLQPSGQAGLFVSPDRLLYCRGEALVSQRVDFARGRLLGEPETLVHSVDLAAVPAFLRLFSAGPNGTVAFRDDGYVHPLVWFDRRGRVVGRPNAVAGGSGVSLSPDESLIAYASGPLATADVWILDSARDVSTKFTFSGHSSVGAFSRDGGSLYYRFFGPKGTAIRKKAVRGGGAEETVFEGDAFEAPMDESPDGKTLIVANLRHNFDLWTLPLGGKSKLVPLVTTDASERGAQFSPEGRWFAYASDESGRFEVYIRRFPVTSEKWQVSKQGGYSPEWRSDGKEIFFVAFDGSLMAAPVTIGNDVAIGAPEALFQTRIRDVKFLRQYAVSRDGQRVLIAYPPRDPETSPLRILLNWRPGAPAR